MPLYQLRCDSCGEEDGFVLSYESAKAGIEHDGCGGRMVKIITTTRVVGPTDTNPASFGGKTFTSMSQISRWENSDDSRGLTVLSPNDRAVKEKRIEIRDKAERKAIAKGFKSERHRQDEVRKEQKLLRERK